MRLTVIILRNPKTSWLIDDRRVDNFLFFLHGADVLLPLSELSVLSVAENERSCVLVIHPTTKKKFRPYFSGYLVVFSNIYMRSV